MAGEKFNPYNYQRYQNLPKPAPIYESSRVLTPIGGMSLEEVYRLRRMKEDAEDATRRERWLDNQGGLHPGPLSAWNTSMGYESNKGEKDCTGGSDL